ncbi:4-oxalocrotonate decarboxylase [Rugosibacter aromaticivorans]|uniref:4-oxalocrotonate decarboxylase n=1 Tax=Rugosibacter aromaticivorans TaxID=1565605 RepID=A0A0C5J0R4_9PROT|nr:2-oxo-3-hexenedioate decarboxylase [Rugosibacter aromaticivorans]AJP48637.1 4-oxalocrotonate decarboxylase [Rugosibacter aromaticivorans]
MALTPNEVNQLCDRVLAAQRGAYAIPKLTDDFPAMTVDDGYAVQAALRRRLCAEGRRQAGWKIGLTSKAKMQQMGVSVPSIGFLMEDTARADGSTISTQDLVHPRVECEIAFFTKAELRGPDCTAEQVLAATDYVVPAIEIIDSRFSGFKFDLPSVIADNGSSARFVPGSTRHTVDALDLRAIHVSLEKNGEPVVAGVSDAVLGNPAIAIAMLVNLLAVQGESLPAESFVMSGAITEAIPVKAGDSIRAKFDGMGSVNIQFDAA